jgi:hypothetical protein
MRKSLSIFSLLTLLIASCFAQSFEGKIKYQNVYKSKLPNVSDEQFTGMMGTTMDYSIKEGNYYSTTNGTFFQWQIYTSKDNKVYTKMANSPAVLWNDAAVNPDEVIKSEINKNATDVLGYKCDELILTCKSGIQKYYYNSKLKLDAKLFENFKYQNWYDFVSRANAVPLKMVVDNAQFSMESTATEVLAQNIDDALFVLPAGAVLEKNPY